MYRVYYHLQSSKRFLPVEEALPVKDPKEAATLVILIKSSVDSVFIFDEILKKKIVISRDKNNELFIEIQSSSGILFRYISIQVAEYLIKNLEDVLREPVNKYSFREESV